MDQINDETLELILSNKVDENFWLFQLGKADSSIGKSDDVAHQFMFSFLEQGEQLWNKHKGKLVNILCDIEKKEPRPLIQELIDGNIKDLVTNILSLLMTTYSLTLAISIPLVAIALKTGITTFCKS